MIRPMRGLFVVLPLALLTAQTSLALETAGIFGDHMVLQADKPVVVWGTHNPVESVTIKFNGQAVTTQTDGQGDWKATLEPMSAGGSGEMNITSGRFGITYHDVLIGEVWLCSGQSNMEWPMSKSMHGPRDLAQSFDPQLRLFLVEKADLDAEPRDVKGRWLVCDADSAADFSAVGYYFGKELRAGLDRPVGLIANAWGGSSAEAWMSRESLLSDPEYAYMIEGLPARRAALEKYNRALREWEAGGSQGDAPPRPREVRQFKWPTVLHDRMLLPLVPYTLRGVIWYQGEENAPRAGQYQRLFPAVIKHWRNLWHDEQMPFLFVQLASFRQRAPEPGDHHWAELREAQAMTLAVPHTAMAVTIDIGDADDIHPRNKHDVGHRLALCALAKVYGQDIEYSGPTLLNATVDGSAIRLMMAHTTGGLKTLDGDPPKGFAIASADGPYHWADARIEGDTVVVWSDKVPEPATVRYGWASNPEATLINGVGLPASPFRTDDRPGVTQGKK